MNKFSINNRIAGIVMFCCISFSAAFSQPAFQSSDFASLNDSFTVSKINALTYGNFSYTDTGAGITWDYSGFVPVSQQIKRFVDPNRTGFRIPYFFSCNTICYNNCYNNCIANGVSQFVCAGACNFNCNNTCLSNWVNKFDLAELANDSINLVVATIKDVYNFYDHTSTELSQVALGARVSNIPFIVDFQTADRIYKFPLAYGNKDTSNSRFYIRLDSIPGTGIPVSLTYKHTQQRYNSVEGWGTLITPYGTFDNVVKLRSEVNNQDTVIFQGDTIALSDFLPVQVLPNRTVEYKWFSSDFGIPLLRVVASEIAGSLVYTDLEYIDTFRCFDPGAVFGYLPLPAIINSEADSVEVNFYNLSVNSDSLYWTFGDTSSPNNSASGTNPSHIYRKGGIYSVRLVACNKICPDTPCNTFTLPVLVIDLSPPTSAAHPHFQDGTIKIYPNPVQDELIIETDFSETKNMIFYLYDLNGRQLAHFPAGNFSSGKQVHRMAVDTLAPGAYMIEARVNGVSAYFKILKSR